MARFLKLLKLPKRVVLVRGVDVFFISVTLGLCIVSTQKILAPPPKSPPIQSTSLLNRTPGSLANHLSAQKNTTPKDLVDVGCLDLYGPRPTIRVFHSPIRIRASLCEEKNLKSLKSSKLWSSLELKSMRNNQNIFVYQELESIKNERAQNISTEFIPIEQGITELRFTVLSKGGSSTVGVALEKN